MSIKTSDRLRALLDRDAFEGSLVVSRKGCINRAHYARLLGIRPSNLWAYHGDLLREYEAKYGIQTGPLARLSEMRAWLDRAYHTGELKTRNGRVDRLTCIRHFKLGDGGVIARYPQIRDLFESFDRRAETEGYTSRSVRDEMEKLTVALKEPILNKDRLTVNRRALARATGITLGRLLRPEFAKAISTCETQIRELATRSDIDPFFSGRVFSFSALAEFWPRPFLERVGARFKLSLSGLAPFTICTVYRILYEALEWIGQSATPACRTVISDAEANGKVLNGRAWEDAVHGYRKDLIDRTTRSVLAKTTADKQITALRMALDGLESGMVVPKMPGLLPGIKNARKRGGGHLKSIAEATSTGPNQPITSYLEFARVRFVDACRLSGSEYDKGELDGFISGIADELMRCGVLANDPGKAILAVLDRRLNALRNAACTIINSAQVKFEEGRRLLAIADIPSAAFKEDYNGKALNARQKKQLIRQYFPYPTDQSDTARERNLANLIKLTLDCLDGVPVGGATSRLGQFLQKRYRELGDIRSVEGLLLPSSDTVGAVLTLYLCEGGANVTVGRTLNRDCIEDSDVAGYARITGHKARAGGKPIFVDLPTDSLAVQAMTWFKSASIRLSARANEDCDRLFLMRVGSRIQMPTPFWYTQWFRTFVASAHGVEGLNLVPSMLRPSILLQAALKHDGRLLVGRAIGQHGSQITQGYQQKWPTRLIYDEQIRRFQTDFEALIVQSIPGAAERLGLSETEMRERLATVANTGLGTLCLKALGTADPPPHLCKTLSCWDDCPYVLIVAEVESIAALQLWQQTLRDAAGEWERDRPERWEKVWLPWLCLADVVEEKMVRGPMIRIWRAAEERALQLKNSPQFIPHRPW